MKRLGKIVLFLMIAVIAFSAFGCSSKGGSVKDDGININRELGYFIKDGGSDYAVLIPEDASAAVKQAADELAQYAQASAGVTLGIVTDNQYSSSRKYISIGRTVLLENAGLNTDYASLNGDGFVLKTVGSDIIVDADTDRGFLYGTYEFIEKYLGVKWLAEDETFIPHIESVTLYETNIVSVPAFKMRVYLNSPNFLMNTNMAYIAHSRTLYDWLDIPDIYGGNANVSRRGNNTHNARFYVPAEKYGTRDIGYSGEFLSEEEGYDPHPELYYVKPGSSPQYEVGGEASGITLNWLNGITEDGKLDETLEVSTAKVVIEEMKKDIVANPKAEYFVLDQEDIGTIMPSDDPMVQKYTAAGCLVRFCNVVIRELQKWADETLDGREIKLVTYAYQQTQPAPVKLVDGEYQAIDSTVIPDENLCIRIATTTGAYYGITDDRQPAEVRLTIKQWSSICHHFWFWGYDTNYTDYISYFPSLGQSYATVNTLYETGVQYVLMQSSYNNPNDWQAYLKGYVYSKLLWDPEQDVQALVNEYLNGYYGKAASYVRAVMDLYDAHFANYLAKEEPDVWFWAYGGVALASTMNAQLLETAVAYIDEAVTLVENDAEMNDSVRAKLLNRLAGVQLCNKWMMLSNYDSVYRQGDGKSKVALAEEVLSLREQNGIKMLNEGTGLAGYIGLNYGV